MQSLTHLALQVDKGLGTSTFTPLYRPHNFRPETIIEQECSPLLHLPTEIRLLIYAYVFTPTPTPSTTTTNTSTPQPSSPSANPLSLLATCRIIHGESLPFALSQSRFYLTYPSIAFQPILQSLGPLRTHLRYIHVTIPVQYLKTYSSMNPFHLSELPLEELVVDLGNVEAGSWMDENAAYHYLMSAMLYRPSSSTSSALTPPRAGLIERTKRKLAIMTLSQWATRSQLHQLVKEMKCKKLVVQADRDEKDVLWSAVTHFGLMGECVTIFEGREEGEGGKGGKWKGGGGKDRRYLICGDEEEKSFLELGTWPPRGYVWDED